MSAMRKIVAVFLMLVILLPITTAASEPTETTVVTEQTLPVPETQIATETPETTEETAASATEPSEITELPTPEPEGTRPPWTDEWNLYFGLLHAHTNLSDGKGSVEEAFQYAANVAGLDFFAVTDHSNSFDNANAGSVLLEGSLISQEWAAGKAAAAAVTGESFVGIFGYEMTWQEGRGLGHINTFATPGWQSRNQPGFSTLKAYYDALTLVPGSISQFNHPGTGYGEFENFAGWCPEYDPVMALLEVGGEGGFTAYRYYTKALDKGWHVAPTNTQNNHNGAWGDASGARTVALAKTLTEESLYEAMAARRVYATEDADFSVIYRLDGRIMGSFIPQAEEHRVQLKLLDPTDQGAVRIQVIADGGTVAAEASAEASGSTVQIQVPGGCRYYYLRLTQPDGDIAVTAPVWTETYTDMGIAAFEADSPVPTVKEPLNLLLRLYNREKVDLELSSVTLYAGEDVIYENAEPGVVAAEGTEVFSIPYTAEQAGTVTFRLAVKGFVQGEERLWETSLTLAFQPSALTADILVDGSHSALDAEDLEHLTALASQAGMTVGIFREEMPDSGWMLIIPPPEREFSEEFIAKIKAFSQNGGMVLLCGQAESQLASGQINRLLEALGSTMRLRRDRALDEIHNGGTPEKLRPGTFNPVSPWCAGLSYDQFFCQDSGCTVEPGSGIWMVRGHNTTHSSETGQSSPVLMASETPASGGEVLLAGSLFLADSVMPIPSSRWDSPRINYTVMKALLGIRGGNLSITAIGRVREAEPGGVYRIKGYVTAGTANKYNTFGDTLYLQDETGGIGVIHFSDGGLALGTPVELLGRLDERNGNPVLDLIDYRILPEEHKRQTSQTLSLETAMNYAVTGGSLVQVEAQVCSVTLTQDGQGVSRFTLVDEGGDQAVVMIEDNIRSGAYGTNVLASRVKVGRTVRVQGIVNLDGNGVRVLRVRNCEEVVYVPPVPRPGENPPTGDAIGITAAQMGISLLLLARILKRKRK